jgi:hypothetical protein
MRYRVWTFQDGQPPSLPRQEGGRPAFPGSYPNAQGTRGRASQPEEVDGLTQAVDRIMALMKGNGLNNEAEEAIVRGRATEALRDRGAYRTALPARGRWVLAEQITPGLRHPLTGEVDR